MKDGLVSGQTKFFEFWETLWNVARVSKGFHCDQANAFGMAICKGFIESTPTLIKWRVLHHQGIEKTTVGSGLNVFRATMARETDHLDLA